MAPYDPARHGPRRIVGPGFHEQVYALVRQVPEGSVTTYGDLAEALGSRGVARHVGYAMSAVPEGSDVPWWRVVAAGGRVSQRGDCAERQALYLKDDGVEVRGLSVQRFSERRHTFPNATSS